MNAEIESEKIFFCFTCKFFASKNFLKLPQPEIK